MRARGRGLNGPSVPFEIESCRGPRTFVPQAADGSESHPANPVRADHGRGEDRVGRGRLGTDADQAGKLADSPRVRVGQPGLAALDPVLRRALPLRAVRRARLRDDRLDGRRPLGRSLGRGPRDRRRGGPPGRSVRAVRDLAGLRGIHRVRRPAPGEGVEADPVRRVCARLGPARAPRDHARVRGDRRADPGRMGQGQPELPPGVHVAVHPGGEQRAARVVQRPLQAHDHGRSGGRAHPRALARRHHGAARPGPRTHAVPARARGCGRDDRRGPRRRIGHPRRRVRGAGLEEPRAARARAGVGPVLCGGAGVHRTRPAGEAGRGVRRADRARARHPRPDHRGPQQRRDRLAARAQRQDRAQPTPSSSPTSAGSAGSTLSRWRPK